MSLSSANRTLFYIAPLLSIPALAAWAVIPFDPTLILANANAASLYILALTSVGVYGVILAGWASNSVRFPRLPALRRTDRFLRERAMDFAGRCADGSQQP